MERSVHQNSDVEFQYYSQTFCTGNRTSNTLLEDSRPWSYLNHRKLGLTCYYLVVISVESNARAQRPQKSRLPFCFCGGKWKSISRAISTLYTSYKPLAQSHAPIWPCIFSFLLGFRDKPVTIRCRARKVIRRFFHLQTGTESSPPRQPNSLSGPPFHPFFSHTNFWTKQV